VGLVKFLRAQWDRAAGACCILAGGLVVLSGWAGVSGAVYPAAQLPYLISAGVGGLFLLGVGATLWLSADLRDEWRHLDALEARVTARLDKVLREEFRQFTTNGNAPQRQREPVTAETHS
jgi:hypothetical protein